LAAREVENQRLRRVEAAAGAALAELDALIGSTESAGDTALSQAENDDPQALRSAERG
jgi:hypothetical protein